MDPFYSQVLKKFKLRIALFFVIASLAIRAVVLIHSFTIMLSVRKRVLNPISDLLSTTELVELQSSFIEMVKTRLDSEHNLAEHMFGYLEHFIETSEPG